MRTWKLLFALTAVLVASMSPAGDEENTISGRPAGGYPVSHTGYSCGYKSKLGCSVWVSYNLKPAYCFGEKALKGEQKVTADPVLTGKALKSPSLGEIEGSGFTPLFFFPAGDSLGRGAEVEKEVYFLSNVASQRAGGVSKKWNELETLVRGWAKEAGEVWVMCGPVFSDESEKTKSGRMTIPDGFYKIVVRKDGSELKTIAFIVPQNTEAGSLESCRTSIDAIEDATDVDFLPGLPDEIETAVESSVSPMWSTAGGPAVTAPADAKAGAGVAAQAEAGPAEAAPAEVKRAPVTATPGKVWVLMKHGLFYRAGSSQYGVGDGTEMDEGDAEGLGFRNATK